MTTINLRRAQRRAIMAGTLRGCIHFEHLGGGRWAVPQESVVVPPTPEEVAFRYHAIVGRIARRLGYHPAGVTSAAVAIIRAKWGAGAGYLAQAVRASDCMSRGHTP